MLFRWFNSFSCTIFKKDLNWITYVVSATTGVKFLHVTTGALIFIYTFWKTTPLGEIYCVIDVQLVLNCVFPIILNVMNGCVPMVTIHRSGTQDYQLCTPFGTAYIENCEFSAEVA